MNTKGKIVRKKHIISSIRPGSPASETDLEKGDELISVNGTQIEDIFDYQYLTEDVCCDFIIKKASTGRSRKYHIEKNEDEDPGLEFESGLMDEYRSCHNHCIFCFIDQMPKGMRDTLYFKDDDSRLSFLQGNYVTLTNMSGHDIDRIIRYRLDPINISFQTTNPELRCLMMGNRFAGEALSKVKRLNEAGIKMNGQIVLCRGINDGDELERSISDLTGFIPNLMSVSIVPVGLSKYREGLYPLEPFTQEDAGKLIDTVERWQKKLYPKYGIHFVHASDEWYINAGRALPQEDTYDGYVQLENGVGMVRLMLEEFEKAVTGLHKSDSRHTFSMITGRLVSPVIIEMTERMREYYPHVRAECYTIRNDYFGEMITVTGLITGQDIVKQLKGRELGEKLCIPENVLRAGERVFLDDMTVDEISDALQVPVDIVKSDGWAFAEMWKD